MENQKTDIYTRVTDKIIADLEQGVRTWMKPWSADHLSGRITKPLRHNGTPYQGMNIILLWAASVAEGYSAPSWMTYRQAKELGGYVQKGAKGETVVFASTFDKTETDDAGKEVEVTIPYMKGYTVFNVEQVEGLPEHYYQKPEPINPKIKRDGQLEAFFHETKADIRHGGDKAYYSPSFDYVQMPHIEVFKDTESYYATLAHEITHWTRHKDRLNREFTGKRFGDAGYAKEELVAELGAAFLCADLQITPETREDHAAYIQHWLKVLKQDKRAIFSAAAHAQRAVDFIKARQKIQAKAAA